MHDQSDTMLLILLQNAQMSEEEMINQEVNLELLFYYVFNLKSEFEMKKESVFVGGVYLPAYICSERSKI
jgi:hypothetical protein